MKQTQDKKQPSNPYTASALMRDQANAGYSSSDALKALIHVFSQYAPGDMAVAAGRLAANPTLTSYTPGAVAVALKANYGSAVGTAAQMRAVLAQVYAGAASLSAQQMANALAAAGYPMGDVAKVLHDNYAPDVPTAAAMATILTQAYRARRPGRTRWPPPSLRSTTRRRSAKRSSSVSSRRTRTSRARWPRR